MARRLLPVHEPRKAAPGCGREKPDRWAALQTGWRDDNVPGSVSPGTTRPGRGKAAKCHVMSCSPCRRRRSALPFLHIVTSVAFRSAPIRPRRRRLGRPQGGGTLVARLSCVRARDGGRTSPARSRRGFSRPQPLLRSRRKAERRPRKPPLHLHSTTRFPQSIPLQTKYEIFAISGRKPIDGVRSHGWAPDRGPGRRYEEANFL